MVYLFEFEVCLPLFPMHSVTTGHVLGDVMEKIVLDRKLFQTLPVSRTDEKRTNCCISLLLLLVCYKFTTPFITTAYDI